MPATIKLKGYRKGRGRKRARDKSGLSKREAVAVKKIVSKAVTVARAKNYRDFYIGTYTNDGRVSAVSDLTHDPKIVIRALHNIPLFVSGDTVSTRPGHEIWIRGLSVTGQILCTGANDMKDCKVEIFLWKQKRPAVPTAANVTTLMPSTVLYNGLNGSLPDESEVEQASKVTILARTVLNIRPIDKDIDYRRNFRLSKWWKRPQKQNYAPAADVNGDNPFDYAYFMSARTGHDLSATTFKPGIVATCRVHYFTE